jgi:uridine kinase
MEFDVFISHASEDKLDVVEPLVARLQGLGLKVWLDATELRIGDSLRRKIDAGLRQSKYGVVVLSPHFFNKEWPQKELDALVAREDGCSKVILPILHNFTHKGVANHSLLLADKLAANTKEGIDIVALQIADAVRGEDRSVDLNVSERTVVGISGGSCSGKTWLAEKLRNLNPNKITLLDLDSYYRERQNVEGLDCKHDNPNAIDFDKAIKDLVLLKAGREVIIPIYDFETHEKVGERVCKPAPLLVVEGLFAFANQPFRDEIDIKVWLNAGGELRYKRRLKRDILERGRDMNEVMIRYDEDVAPGFERYIKPLQSYAHIVLENNMYNLDPKPLLVDYIISHIRRVKPSAFNVEVEEGNYDKIETIT